MGKVLKLLKEALKNDKFGPKANYSLPFHIGSLILGKDLTAERNILEHFYKLRYGPKGLVYYATEPEERKGTKMKKANLVKEFNLVFFDLRTIFTMS